MGISRRELWEKLGLVKIVEPVTQAAYDSDELNSWLQDLNSSPHGEPWHTSFHASSFPGNDPKACSRKAMYGLMNIPDSQPTSRWLRALADAGQDIETQVVKRWGKAGILLSADRSAGEDIQTGFVRPDVWLTGAIDALILPPGWNRFHPVEVKTKSAEVIKEMKRLMREPDEKHVIQAKTYVGLSHDDIHVQFPRVAVCQDNWVLATKIVGGWCPIHGGDNCLKLIDIEPTIDGTIYYISRDSPSDTHEFRVEYDPEFMGAGMETLAQWKQSFIDEDIPQTQAKSHPFGWKWTDLPCKYCTFKRDVCKPDFKANITKLPQSHGVKVAKEIRPTYSYEESREAVLDRWKDN